ncbi:MAG: 2,3-bisphosphoglycerate-dependent phosphoglycerate mutase [Chlamydiia bacterium]|nr:2,3-bisphosphoglycerate-dependent phosphoglycerate mutase [Chlamydiia bacterium]
MGTLILIRHGQSVWNQKNLFTGWVDVPLSEKGIDEALAAGELIKHLHFDAIFTSTLIRAQTTLTLAMSKNHTPKTLRFKHNYEDPYSHYEDIHSDNARENVITVHVAPELNERMYGNLQGLNKDDARKEWGEDQVQIWRRSYNVAPPNGESLEDTIKRAYPYFQENIEPLVREGKTVLIAAHGNSLRGIMCHLNNLTHDEVVKLEIDTGRPIHIEFKDNKWVDHGYIS